MSMKMSCNGCRVLRKGCSDDCTIRPCLSWIRSPESQANATVFLAKFYGRAGLINLISAGPDHIRPAIFRSLLYEACGRIVSPTYGSVGLLWSGTWHLCQAAVESVLKGETVGPVPAAVVDIRHVSKDPLAELHKVNGKSKTPFKRAAHNQVQPGGKTGHLAATVDEPIVGFQRARSHEFSAESLFSAEAGSHVSQGEPEGSGSGEEELELELTLGFEPIRPAAASAPAAKGKVPAELDGWDDLALGGII